MSTTPLIENKDLRVGRCRHGLMLYNVNDVYIGRALALYGEYCEEEAALYRSLLREGDIVIEAGANIGCFTLVLAGTVGAKGAVLAFEPQRQVFQMLCANLALNGVANVRTWQAGLGAAAGQLTVPPVNYRKAGNFGGISLTEAGQGERVAIATIDSLGLGRCSLIKIDVQGMEGEVLRGAQATIEKTRPVLYVENDLKEKSPALIQQLFELGYRLYWHLPRLFSEQNYFGNAENVFVSKSEKGLLQRLNINMLGLPKSDTRQVRLREITSPDDWWRAA